MTTAGPRRRRASRHRRVRPCGQRRVARRSAARPGRSQTSTRGATARGPRRCAAIQPALRGRDAIRAWPAARSSIACSRTRLEGREHCRRARSCSSSPARGWAKERPTTSANLALTMSQEFQHRVLLVEADLRRPVLAEFFGAAPGPGLVDVVTGTATIDDALVRFPGSSCSSCPPAPVPRGRRNCSRRPSMQRSLDTLRSRFDRIVIDTPPMTLADTHVLARLADGAPDRRPLRCDAAAGGGARAGGCGPASSSSASSSTRSTRSPTDMPTPAHTSEALRSRTRDHACVQSVRLAATPDRLHRRAAGDFRIDGICRAHVPAWPTIWSRRRAKGPS